MKWSKALSGQIVTAAVSANEWHITVIKAIYNFFISVIRLKHSAALCEILNFAPAIFLLFV